MARRSSALVLLSLIFLGCALSSREPGLTVGWEDDGLFAPRIGSLELRGISGLEAEDVWLVQGKLNQKALAGVFARNPAESVVKRRVPAFVRVFEEEILVRPTVRLEAAELYSVVALGTGLLTVVETRGEQGRILSRLGSAGLPRNGVATYCVMERGVPLEGALEEPLESEDCDAPLGGRIRVHRGVGTQRIFSDSCVQFELMGGEEDYFLPPRKVFGVELDPAPIALTSPESAALSTFACGEESCLVVRGSVLESVVSPDLSFLEARAPGRVLRAFAQNAPLRLGPLEPDLNYATALVFDWAGTIFEVSSVQSAGPGAAVFVLNEVLANPSGPEPQQEWVEILNAGNVAASLSGYRLKDSGGETVLPDVFLSPGEFGVVVRADWSADPRVDAVPVATAVRIVVDQIGRGGLRNDGEMLELLDPDGRLVSLVPAIATKPGKSVARIDPLAPDLPESFSLEEPTPGSPNQEAVRD